jgi:hypothetical protein
MSWIDLLLKKTDSTRLWCDQAWCPSASLTWSWYLLNNLRRLTPSNKSCTTFIRPGQSSTILRHVTSDLEVFYCLVTHTHRTA